MSLNLDLALFDLIAHLLLFKTKHKANHQGCYTHDVISIVEHHTCHLQLVFFISGAVEFVSKSFNVTSPMLSKMQKNITYYFR